MISRGVFVNNITKVAWEIYVIELYDILKIALLSNLNKCQIVCQCTRCSRLKAKC